MARKAKKTIPIPSDWEAPLYQFGQHVKQGQIVGMEYFLKDDEIYKQTGVNWCYWCADARQLKMYAECQIEPLSTEEIKELINAHGQEIETLRTQLKTS